MFTVLVIDPDEMKQQLGTEWAKVREGKVRYVDLYSASSWTHF